MELGDHVSWSGRVYVLRGLEPMSIPDRHAELEDPMTGERIRVPMQEITERPPEQER